MINRATLVLCLCTSIATAQDKKDKPKPTDTIATVQSILAKESRALCTVTQTRYRAVQETRVVVEKGVNRTVTVTKQVPYSVQLSMYVDLKNGRVYDSTGKRLKVEKAIAQLKRGSQILLTKQNGLDITKINKAVLKKGMLIVATKTDKPSGDPTKGNPAPKPPLTPISTIIGLDKAKNTVTYQYVQYVPQTRTGTRVVQVNGRREEVPYTYVVQVPVLKRAVRNLNQCTIFDSNGKKLTTKAAWQRLQKNGKLLVTNKSVADAIKSAGKALKADTLILSPAKP